MRKITCFERVKNLWLRKLLYERENLVMLNRGMYRTPDQWKDIKSRMAKVERIINEYGD